MWSAKKKDDFRGTGALTETAIFNPATGTSSAMTVTNTNHDMFCPGISTLGSGAVVVTGGATAEKTSIYMPGQGWVPGPNMNIPRGYQGQCTLGDGRVRLRHTCTLSCFCALVLPLLLQAGSSSQAKRAALCVVFQ
jgi:galactose oxidase